MTLENSGAFAESLVVSPGMSTALLGHPCATGGVGVGAGRCALVLRCQCQLLHPGPAHPQKSYSWASRGKTHSRKQGGQCPRPQHEAQMLSDKWLEKANLPYLCSPVVVVLSGVATVAKQGKRLFCRKHAHVSTPSTLEIFMYSIKLKVFLTCNPLYSTETSLKLWKLKSQLIWTGTEIWGGMLTWTRCGSDPKAFKTWWCVYLGTVQHWALISLYLIFWEKASFYKASIAKRNKKVQHTTLYKENLTLSPQNISVSSVIFGCIFTDRVIPRPLLLWWKVHFFI